MKVTTERLEAALRQKRLAAGEQVRPTKRARRRVQAEPAQALEIPVAQASTDEPVGEVPVEGAVPVLAEAEVEEGMIPTTTGVTVMVLDPKEETPAAADLVEAGQVAVASGPPVPAESEVERAPPSAGEGEAVVRGSDAGARRPSKHRTEAGSSSRRSMHRPARRLVDETLGGPARPAPKLSTIEDAARAAVLLSRARTSTINKEMGWQSHATVLDMVMVNVLQLDNGAFALRAAATHTGEALSCTLGRVNKYKEQSRALSEKLARQQEEAKARKEDLGGRVREAECRVKIESNRASAAETKLALISTRLEAASKWIEELTRQLHQSESQADTAMDEVQAAMERAVAAERAAVDASHERAGAVAHAHEASARAEKAEGRAWEVEARVMEVKAEAGEAKVKAREAEAKTREAEAQAETAVANYKASADFEQEVIEATLDAFTRGFDLCKVKVSAAFNINSSDLKEIQAEDLGGEEPAEEEEVGEEPRPSRP